MLQYLLLVLQEMRTTHDPDNDANKATLKKHVVRAINNLAGKDAPKATAAPDAQSCCQKSDGGASTFSRYACAVTSYSLACITSRPISLQQTCCVAQIRVCSVVSGKLQLPDSNPAQIVNLSYADFACVYAQ